MKPHERRATGAYPYYKLAEWVPHLSTFRDGKRTYVDERAAREDARAPGRYRISEITDTGRTDGEPFTVPDPSRPAVPAARDKEKQDEQYE